jgi:hypothetical protein
VSTYKPACGIQNYTHMWTSAVTQQDALLEYMGLLMLMGCQLRQGQ